MFIGHLGVFPLEKCLCKSLANFWIGFFYFLIHLFICLCWVLVVAMWTLNRVMKDLVPWPGIKPRPLALEAESLNHWTTREVPESWVAGVFYIFWISICYQIYDLQIFSPFPLVAFSCCWHCPLKQKASIWNGICFSFVVCAFGVIHDYSC